MNNENVNVQSNQTPPSLTIGKILDNVISSSLSKDPLLRIIVAAVVLTLANISTSVVSFIKHNESKHNRSDLSHRTEELEDKVRYLEDQLATFYFETQQ